MEFNMKDTHRNMIPIAERRRALLCLALTGLLPSVAFAQASSERLLVEVWKSPTCGCCKDWIRHLEANGFRVRTSDDGNTDVRERLGIPLRYGSCHTARVGGYALEGHVPAREIRRLLKEKTSAVGLAVPAMPIGSPGMDGPEYLGQKDPYDVLLVKRDGSSTVYQSYR
jgi:hypothetical protein